MSPMDRVERIDSDPNAHAKLVAPDHDTTELYERHLFAVCHSIRKTPVGFFDAKYVVQVLSTLASAAANSLPPDVIESIDILADQIKDL